jgi:ribosomal protein S18 acetylase RimI-like enzyme
MPSKITYKTSLSDIDWHEMKTTLAADNFDNGRTPEQLRDSFENSFASVIAYDENRIIGTSRVLSDGVCNAYLIDVWTLSEYRNQGIARAMITELEKRLDGQHVYLFSDDAAGFYEKLGYCKQAIGLGKVIGTWLRGSASSTP